MKVSRYVKLGVIGLLRFLTWIQVQERSGELSNERLTAPMTDIHDLRWIDYDSFIVQFSVLRFLYVRLA